MRRALVGRQCAGVLALDAAFQLFKPPLQLVDGLLLFIDHAVEFGYGLLNLRDFDFQAHLIRIHPASLRTCRPLSTPESYRLLPLKRIRSQVVPANPAR